jgi:hypothetical protein
MEGAVVWRSIARVWARIATRTNGRQRERRTERTWSESVPIELQLRKLCDRRRFDGCGGG